MTKENFIAENNKLLENIECPFCGQKHSAILSAVAIENRPLDCNVFVNKEEVFVYFDEYVCMRYQMYVQRELIKKSAELCIK